VSLFCNYGSERPRACVRPLTSLCRGLSGIGWHDDGVVGELELWAAKSTRAVQTRSLVSPFEALGEVDATDPLAEIEASSDGWARSVCCRSNSIGDR
jgi:hypothetical protein